MTTDFTGFTFTDDIGTTFTVLGNRRWVDAGFFVWDVFNDSVVPGGAIVNLSEDVLLQHIAELNETPHDIGAGVEI